MSNGINAYNNARLNPYTRAQQIGEVAGAAAARQAAPARPVQAPAAPPAGDLSTAEQRMIDRYFPASESMSMRLYGPGRGAHTVHPGAVGSRLDLRG